ncbi:MAG TPA: metal ABC transporter permease [Anaeromyxobacteraceae bacterium]
MTTARYLARSLGGMFAIAVATAVAATVAGAFLASRLHRPSGPVMVAVAAGIFFAGLLVRRRA